MAGIQQVLMSYGSSVATYTTWDPSYLNTNSALSNGNLDTASASGGTHFITRSVKQGFTAGTKKYIEFKIKTLPSGTPCFGIDDGTAGVNSSFLGSTAGAWAILNNTGTDNRVFNNSSQVATVSGAFASNDIIGMAVDRVLNKIQFYLNNVAILGSISITNTDYYAAIGSFGTPTTNVNFGATPFVYAVPAGYTGGILA